MISWSLWTLFFSSVICPILPIFSILFKLFSRVYIETFNLVFLVSWQINKWSNTYLASSQLGSWWPESFNEAVKAFSFGLRWHEIMNTQALTMVKQFLYLFLIKVRRRENDEWHKIWRWATFFLSLALMKKHHLFEKWAQDFLRNDDAGDVAAIPNYASLNRMNIN